MLCTETKSFEHLNHGHLLAEKEWLSANLLVSSLPVFLLAVNAAVAYVLAFAAQPKDSRFLTKFA